MLKIFGGDINKLLPIKNDLQAFEFFDSAKSDFFLLFYDVIMLLLQFHRKQQQAAALIMHRHFESKRKLKENDVLLYYRIWFLIMIKINLIKTKQQKNFRLECLCPSVSRA